MNTFEKRAVAATVTILTLLGFLIGFQIGGIKEQTEIVILAVPVEVEASTIALNRSSYTQLWFQYFNLTKEYNENHSYFLCRIVFSTHEPNTSLVVRFWYEPVTYGGANIHYEAYAIQFSNKYNWRIIDFDIQPPSIGIWSRTSIGLIFVGYSDTELPMSFYPPRLTVLASHEVLS